MELTVETNYGIIKGEEKKTSGGKPYICFSGIPYAEPPIGKLRFKDPVEVKKWKGIKDATKEGDASAQLSFLKQEYIGSEDCLYLNVYTPNLNIKPDNVLPVLVQIHGGGFIGGSGSIKEFGPQYFIEHDVIVVNINYRLGVLGFLCTDPVNAPGDMGLKDQNLALKWVKANIKYFGGDSDNITLIGCSAGAASVDYHILSPKSKNLFNKAIMMSGSALNPWARIRNPFEQAEKLAKLLGYESSCGNTVFEFLNSIEAEKLVKTTKTMLNDDVFVHGNFSPFAPVVNMFEGYDGFLNEEPEDILSTGTFNKVPTISAVCEKEGMFLVSFYYADPRTKANLEVEKFIDYVPNFFDKNVENLSDILKNMYTKKEHDVNENEGLINFLSDMMFNSGIIHGLNKRLLHNPNDEYFYKFTYGGNINVGKIFVKNQIKESCHGDDNGYICDTVYHGDNTPTEDDLVIRKKMVQLFVNFMNNGKPTAKVDSLINVDWPPVTSDKFNYLNMGRKMEIRTSLNEERKGLWNKLQYSSK